MTTIQTSNASSTKVVSREEANGTGANAPIFSSKQSVKDSSVNKNGLISQAVRQEDGVKENKTVGPSLRVPLSDLNLDDAQCAALASALGDIRDDPELENKIDALRTQATALAADAPRSNAAGFNIMSVSSQPTDLLIAFLLLMLQSRVADAKFNSAMMLNNAAAVGKTADSIRDEGLKQTLGGVLGGVFTLVGTGVGLALGATAQIKDRLNQKNVLTPMKERQAEANMANGSLHGAKGSVKSADELKSVNVKAPDGSDKTVRVASSDTALSAENETKISETINANKQILDRGDALANEANQKTIDKLKLGGELFTAAGGVGSLISNGVQVEIKADQAAQQISGLDARVAGQGSEDAREKAKALIALVNEMLQAMVAFNQSRNATFSAVAGNLRG